MIENNRSTWPLFWCLSAKAQANLMQFQWDRYGGTLDIPKPRHTSEGVWQTVVLENQEEIERIMSQAPHQQKRVV